MNGFENATGETKQPVTLGIDAGYKHIGFSAVTEKRELISGEAVHKSWFPVPEFVSPVPTVHRFLFIEFGYISSYDRFS